MDTQAPLSEQIIITTGTPLVSRITVGAETDNLNECISAHNTGDTIMNENLNTLLYIRA